MRSAFFKINPDLREFEDSENMINHYNIVPAAQNVSIFWETNFEVFLEKKVRKNMPSLGKKLIFSFFHTPISCESLKKLFSQGIMSDFVRVFFKLFSMVISRILWEQNFNLGLYSINF